MNKIVNCAVAVTIVFCWTTLANAHPEDRTLQPSAGDPLPELTDLELERFLTGKAQYATDFQGDPRHGPLSNATSCATCHGTRGGDGITTVTQFGFFDSNTGIFDPLAHLGGPVLQTTANPGCSEEAVPPEANVQVLRRTVGTMGFGLVEALDDADLLANADPTDADGDGVSGRAHVVRALEAPDIDRIGRFGWKSQLPSVRSFSADAARNELGLTNHLVPTENRANDEPGPDGCGDMAEDPELSEVDEYLEAVIDFQRLMAPPPQSPRAGMAGEMKFNSIGCNECHSRRFTTPDDPELEAALRNVDIQPYSDFLLHELANDSIGVPDGIMIQDEDGTVHADQHEVRTPALWGLRNRTRFMHDASINVNALDFEPAVRQAIDHHHLEGAGARDAFNALAPSDQEEVIAFLHSLGRLDFDLNGNNTRDAGDLDDALECLGLVTPDEDCGTGDLDGNRVLDSTELSRLCEALEVFEDCNENMVDDSVDIELQFSLDDNGDFIPDECQTSCSARRIRALGVGGTIPDGIKPSKPTPALETSVMIAQEDHPITDVRLTITGFYHNWAGQLTISITHRRTNEPDVTVLLGSQDGEDWNLSGTYVFDDDGSFHMDNSATLHNGPGGFMREAVYTVAPSSSTSLNGAFATNGRTPEGEWILSINDDTITNTGSIDSWTLEITVDDDTIGDDSDGDGTPNCIDGCPDDVNKIEAGICGCGVSDVDTDNDGTEDCIDGCPDDVNKIEAGICGCGVSDVDTDNDGTEDCIDGCPDDVNKIEAGICGCGVSDVDTDNDGTEDCIDGCPDDVNKIEAGICGCGVSDVDTDNDGTEDCIDGCPDDVNKIEAGICGCGVSDVDTDNDGTEDCIDGCPDDVNKIEAGECGCGVEETPDCGGTNPGDAIQWRVEDGGNGHWYGFFPALIPWSDARSAAESVGGYLCCMETSEEWVWIRTELVEPIADELFSDGGWGVCIGGVQNLDSPDYSEPYGGWEWLTGVPFQCGGEFDCNMENYLGVQHNMSLLRNVGFPIQFNDIDDVPDQPYYMVEWSADCNGDGIVDYGQILDGTFADDDGDGVPDACESDDANVWVWGRNTDGECEVPSDLMPVVEVEGGGYHLIALQVDGSLRSWGRNDHGQTEPPEIDSHWIDVAGGDLHSIGLDAEGVVHCWGSNGMDQCDVPAGMQAAIAVAAGANHSLALFEDGTVTAWGYNLHGATNVPADLNDVVKLAGGAHHSAALLADGSIVAWGGEDDEDDVPEDLAPFIDVKAVSYNTIALTADGVAVLWGRGLYGQDNVPADLGIVTAVGIGSHVGFAKTEDGVIHCWGNGSNNECTIPAEATAATDLGISNLHGTAWIARPLNTADCNGDGIVDYGQILDGTFSDDNDNGVPDCCEDGSCPPSGAVRWRVADGGNGHWYDVRMVDYAWPEASEAAANEGGHLATLTSEAENTWVFDNVASDPEAWNGHFGPWIGGFQDTTSPDYSEPDGGWTWVSGETWNYTNWGTGDPSNTNGQDHLAFSGPSPSSPIQRFWNDLSSEPIAYIIEWSADCNGDGIVDYGQILDGTFVDEDGNGVPDICELIIVEPGESIQAAIDAIAGGVVRVQPGIYYENLDLSGRAITLESVAGAETTIIDGGNYGSVIRATSDTGTTMSVIGFTLINGSGTATSSETHGGAMYMIGERLTVDSCIFRNNAAYHAGAIYAEDSTSENDFAYLTVLDCTFETNTAIGQGGAIAATYADISITSSTFTQNQCLEDGNTSLGGACAFSASDIALFSCLFDANSTVESSGGTECLGGGVECHGGVTGSIEQCIFQNNVASYGGGLYLEAANIAVNDCQFIGNMTMSGGGSGAWNHSVVNLTSYADCLFQGNIDLEGQGAGVYNFESSPSFDDCMFNSNEAEFGGGMYNTTSAPTITNCTFDSNSATQTGGGLHDYSNDGVTSLTDCTLRGNTAGDTGGAIYNQSAPAELRLTRTVVCDNSADQIAGGITDNGGNCITEICNDCNGDGVIDCIQIIDGTLDDDDGNSIPNVCEEVLAWGSNDSGQIDVPVSLTNVKKISSGEFHSMALLHDGTVVCWGENSDNQCDVPSDLGVVIDIDAGEFYSLALIDDGSLRAWGANYSGQINVPSVNNAIAVSAGDNHAIALLSDNSAIGWGDSGNFADPPQGVQLIQICAGVVHNIGLANDGQVYCWGSNNFGECDVPTDLGTCSYVWAAAYFSLAVKTDGTVVAWGKNDHGQSNVPGGLPAIRRVSAGDDFAVALADDGSIWRWGEDWPGLSDMPELGPVREITAGGHGQVLVRQGADDCPDDPDKVDPGLCGCGVPDVDTDTDGTLDCVDNCPNDPDKTEPGDCGCGVPDTDTDGDGIADCIDPCPNWPYDCSEDGQTLTVAVGQSIQDAIDAAPENGRVLLAPGVHMANVVASERAITIGASDPSLETILDGGGNGAVISATTENGILIQISDLTIQNGTGSDVVGYPSGGGISVVGNALQIQNCIIRNCQAHYGGGIYLEGDDAASIIDCQIEACHATNRGGGLSSSVPTTVQGTTFQSCSSDGRAGGAVLGSDSNELFELIGCTFTSCVAQGDGGGIYTLDTAELNVESSLFTSNDSADQGGGISLRGSKCWVTDTVFIGNIAEFAGGLNARDADLIEMIGCEFTNNDGRGSSGGCELVGVNDLTVTDCIFTGNRAMGEGPGWGSGGGLRINSTAFTVIDSCTITGNESFGDGEHSPIGAGLLIEDSTVVNLSNTFICGNTPDQISGAYEDLGGNCISDVCDSDGDETLDCVDNCPNDPDKTEPGDCGCGNPDTDTDGDTIPDCIDPCPNWPYDCSEDGQTIYVAVGEPIQNAINFVPNGGTVELADGSHHPSAVLTTGGRPMTILGGVDSSGQSTTLVDGLDAQRIFICNSGEGSDTVFENLWIRGGYHNTNGGGMLIQDSSPSVVNCIFQLNNSLDGGAVYLENSSTTFTTCAFWSNNAGWGGGLYAAIGCDLQLTGCDFQGNSANYRGGGLLNNNSTSSIAQCLFKSNTAGDFGGAMYLPAPASTPISNTVICGNAPGTSQIYPTENYTDLGGNCISDVCDSDSDSDGTLDCYDNCPDDPDKTEPGDCGCGVPDTDTDGDTIPDCIDPCPNWPYNCSEDGQTLTVAVGQSIQDAIDAVPDGGTVAIAAGAFPLTDPLDPGGRAMTIRGPTDVDGNPTAILDGQDSTRVLICESGETVETLFENLVITRGNAGDALRGGGMYCYQSSPSIINCTFLLNHAEQGGGALYNEDHSSPQVSGCFFSRNSTEVDGGAVFNYLSSSPAFTACTFSENTGRLGGALANQDDADCSFTNCLFVSNSADPYTSPAHGGAIFNNSSDPQIMNCTFTDNHAESDGGAIYNMGDSIISIDDSVFTGNNAAQGNAIANAAGTVDIQNSRICDNRTTVKSFTTGHDHSVVLTGDGRVLAWGGTPFGEVNMPSSITDRTDPDWRPVTSVNAGSSHTAAVRDDGSVVFWGHNPNNECDVPADVGVPGREVVLARLGEGHSAVLLADGSVSCWGNNGAGQCNAPAAVGDPDNPVIDIECGGYHTVALLENGDVHAWGTLPFTWDASAEDLMVVDIAAGSHTTALMEDGSIRCWSGNPCTIPSGIGEKGLRVVEVHAGHLQSFALLEDQSFVGWSTSGGLYTLDPSFNDPMNPVVSHDIHAYHVMAIRSDGTLIATGRNDYNQLDIPNELTMAGDQIAGAYNDNGGNCISDVCDSDGDETLDCVDNCPNDPNKTEPGDCGCGNPDTDTDGDGIADCIDPCPNWPYDCSEDGQTLTVAVGQSIQDAIDAAPDGGRIAIASGTHVSSQALDLGEKSLAIQGSVDNENAPATILDGEGSRRIMQALSLNGNSGSVIENLVFINGSSSSGGGLYVNVEGISITNCRFSQCAASLLGGGVYVGEGMAQFTGCEFTENSAGDDGGAIAKLPEQGELFIDDCLFTGNESADSGGALYNNGTIMQVVSSVFEENAAWVGAAFRNNHSTVGFIDCQFIGNTATEDGGAIYNNDGTTELSGSTVCANSSDQIFGNLIDLGGNCISDVCDSDGDETLDCVDNCPNDPDKTEPGDCGCGNPDTDTDGDTIPDCIDPCPNWPYDCSEDGQTIYVAVGEPIQNAINFVPNGGTVELADGSHHPSAVLTTGGRPMTILGGVDSSGQSTTLVDGLDAQRIFICNSGEGSDTVFENLWIRGGYHNTNGGGMLIQDSSPSVVNCIFQLNNSSDGGAVYLENSSTTFTTCAFWNNNAGWGGGLYAAIGCDLQLTGCDFQGNSANHRGGGLLNNNSTSSIAQCLFKSNTAGDFGGAMYLPAPASTPISNTVICGNAPGTSQIYPTENYTDLGGNCISEICDSDVDGTPDCLDNCPDDPDKTEPGDCGCGVPDTDTDGDTIPDCIDPCPNWPYNCSEDGQTIYVAVGEPIQDAINFVPDGGTVELANGSHYLSAALTTGGRPMTIQGELDDNGSLLTTIDAEGSGNVIVFQSGEGSDTEIRDLILTGGSAVYGGGVECSNASSPTIIGCLIVGNFATEYGGGINCYLDSNPLIEACTISGNTALLAGGGISVDASGPRIIQCLVEGNDAPEGAGFYGVESAATEIGQSTICGNVSEQISGDYDDLSGNCILDDCGNDLDENGIPDGCDPDCDGDGEPDAYEISSGQDTDCNTNSIPDACELADGSVEDCNANGVPDSCDVDSGFEADDNENGIPDACEIAAGDFNLDGCIDGADLAVLLGLWGFPNPPFGDLNGDGLVDGADLARLLGAWGGCGG